MSLPTDDILRSARAAPSGAPAFEPGVALAILDDLVDGLDPDTGAAWDAAWIACLTGSPLWVEAAHRAFVRAMGDVGPRGE